MIEYSNGSIFDADVEVLINPVNCVGVMGAGLAKEFKVRYPLQYSEYARVCKKGYVMVGVPLWIPDSGQTIIHLPTKHHWKDQSTLEGITKGISNLVKMTRFNEFESIAIPALGCGLGGLNWSDVLPIMLSKLETLRYVRIIIYPPKESHDSIPS